MSTGRIILHIDMNSYFASVEQQANPFLRGKPIGITGKHVERSVITTASIEAKALGVKTAMSTWEAKRICPSLILWPGDPYKYSNITERFNKIFHEFTSHVEVFSVDESFLDITSEAGDYFTATYIAQMLRERLREECGERITASIGIAPNKLMAKLASEHVKPNGLTVARPEDILALLDNSELDDLCGIGPRIKTRLNRLGIETFQQLREFPLEDLEQIFNRYGIWLHKAAHGHDSSIILSPLTKGGVRGVAGGHENNPKSYGHSYTLPTDTHDPLVVKRYLLGLADKVAWRLRRDGYTAGRVTAFIRFSDMTSMAEQRSFKEPTNEGLQLFQIAWLIVRKLCVQTGSSATTIRRRSGLVPSKARADRRGPEHWLPPEQPMRVAAEDPVWTPSRKRIRLVGLSASNLTQGVTQPPLFKKEQKIHAVLPALDTIQSRYGTGAWTRASLVKTIFKKRSSGFHFDHLI